jgi:hypothetical protein
MLKKEIVDLQTFYKELGFYAGVIDGLWGPLSEAAKEKTLAKYGDCKELIWSSKLSTGALQKVKHIVEKLGGPKSMADDLMACMAWESGETFSPSIKNGAGSGATGLIQFMPKTASGLGTSVDRLTKMSVMEQLDWVYAYFKPYRGRLKNLGDLYMSILWPRGIGQPDSYVLWEKLKSPTTFRQNAGLDVNRDGKVTRGECLAKVNEKYQRGKNYKAI